MREGDLLHRETAGNFFQPGAKRFAHVAVRATTGRSRWASKVEVFLDGTETKSEDCHKGAGTIVLDAHGILPEVNVASP